MRSRAAQLAFGAAAVIAVAGAALFITSSEQRIAVTRTSQRAFDAVVRETTSSVAEFRGEGVATSMDALRAMARSGKARAALDEAAKADNFTEIAAILDHVNAARTAEQDAADAAEAAQRRLEAIALGGAALVILISIAGAIVFGAPASAAHIEEPPAAESVPESAPAAGYMPSRPAGPVLRAASQLCTDFGRVSDVEELRTLVGRAADVMDASGAIVWMSSPDGTQLMPALSHGYGPEILSRVPPLSRSADNAAARAFRTAQLQIVLAHPGVSNGAIVAPVLASTGCVGVFSAEIRGGGETSESVQALAAIFAAQLAGVLHTTPDAHEPRAATGTDA